MYNHDTYRVFAIVSHFSLNESFYFSPFETSSVKSSKKWWYSLLNEVKVSSLFVKTDFCLHVLVVSIILLWSGFDWVCSYCFGALLSFFAPFLSFYLIYYCGLTASTNFLSAKLNRVHNTPSHFFFIFLSLLASMLRPFCFINNNLLASRWIFSCISSKLNMCYLLKLLQNLRKDKWSQSKGSKIRNCSAQCIEIEKH